MGRTLATAWTLLILQGCNTLNSVPVGLLYSNVRTPRAYRSATPIDVDAKKTDPWVTGQACNRSVLYLISWGDSGYARAVKSALKEDPNATLYDVNVDARVRSFVLGIYNDNCTFLTARRGKPR